MTAMYGSSTVKRRRRTNAELAKINDAIIEVARAEHPVSLRGVFYRVESMGLVEKTDLGYRLVGRQLLALRRAGTIPYTWITDGTRYLTKPDSWGDLEEMLDDAAASYRRALWRDQLVDVHVFVEKDAISGVVYPVTSKWDVPLGVLRGYASESFAYSVADAVKHALRRNKQVFIYQLGDHDPSGVDAWRDLREKVLGFLGEWGERQYDEIGAMYEPVVFERLAVTEEQITELSLPTRPTKAKDTRSAKFRGDSVEVDAIPSPILRDLVERSITQHIDAEALRLTRAAEESERTLLYAMKGQVLS